MLYVTLADVKAHLRIDGNDEDALLSQYIEAAQAMGAGRMKLDNCIKEV